MKKLLLLLITLLSGVFASAQSRIYADVNGDGEVNISDVNAVIDAILGGTTPTPPPETGEIETFTVNGVSFSMVKVEGGTFTMGGTSEQGDDAWDREKPTHKVTLSPYSIGQTEVTQALWIAVMEDNPSYYSSRKGFEDDFRRPVEDVNWYACQKFIQKLNELTGKTFRFPTEAEWEFAARGGNNSNHYKFSGSNNLDDVAWFRDNSGNCTHPVATKAPNELGIYDMSGNVYEWCWDGSYLYDVGAQTDPGSNAGSSYRIIRGGRSNSYETQCRVSFRSWYSTSAAFNDTGLRLAM